MHKRIFDRLRPTGNARHMVTYGACNSVEAQRQDSDQCFHLSYCQFTNPFRRLDPIVPPRPSPTASLPPCASIKSFPVTFRSHCPKQTKYFQLGCFLSSENYRDESIKCALKVDSLSLGAVSSLGCHRIGLSGILSNSIGFPRLHILPNSALFQ